MRRKILAIVPAVAAVFGLALMRPASAQGLDCHQSILKAQAAIEKTTDDLKGMEGMPKEQLLQVHVLIDDARMYLDGARHNCDKPQGDFDLARAVGKAGAAAGYATAADMLHFQFMKSDAGMKGMGGPSSGTSGGSMGSMPGMGGTSGAKGMGGTK